MVERKRGRRRRKENVIARCCCVALNSVLVFSSLSSFSWTYSIDSSNEGRDHGNPRSARGTFRERPTFRVVRLLFSRVTEGGEKWKKRKRRRSLKRENRTNRYPLNLHNSLFLFLSLSSFFSFYSITISIVDSIVIILYPNL